MKFSSLVVAFASLALSGTALAPVSDADHAAPHGQAAASAPAPTADGEVRKVDKEQAKITLRHGPIAHLDMPGMTMVFKVADPRMLDSVKPGDKVKFAADNINGSLTVTAIEPAR